MLQKYRIEAKQDNQSHYDELDWGCIKSLCENIANYAKSTMSNQKKALIDERR